MLKRLFHLTRLIVIAHLLVSAAIADLRVPAPSLPLPDPALRSLFESPTRPTIAQVIEVVGLHAEKNTHNFEFVFDQKSSLAQEQLFQLPRVIAFMEYAYPNAIWAPLGRDAVMFGDLLDAFYTANGQAGRVARLNASGGSIRNVDPSSLVRFLKDAGLQLKRSPRPFVGLDRTRYGSTSQARFLLEAAYAAYAAQGVYPSSLIRKVNFIGLNSGLNPNSYSNEEADSYFERHRGASAVRDILQVQVGDWIDTATWHDTFGALAQQPNGRWEGTPGTLAAPRHRQSMLSNQIRLLQSVTTQDFMDQVVDEAHKLGYDFRDRSSRSTRKIRREIRTQKRERAARKRSELLARIKPIADELSARFKSLPVLNEAELKTRPLNCLRYSASVFPQSSPVAYSIEHTYLRLQHQFGESPVPEIPLHLVSEAAVAYENRQLGYDDLRYFVAMAFSVSDIDSEFYASFKRISRAHPVVAELLSRDAVLFFARSSGFMSRDREKIREVFLEAYRNVFGKPVDTDALNWQSLQLSLGIWRAYLDQYSLQAVLDQLFPWADSSSSFVGIVGSNSTKLKNWIQLASRFYFSYINNVGSDANHYQIYFDHEAHIESFDWTVLAFLEALPAARRAKKISERGLYEIAKDALLYVSDPVPFFERLRVRLESNAELLSLLSNEELGQEGLVWDVIQVAHVVKSEQAECEGIFSKGDELQ